MNSTCVRSERNPASCGVHTTTRPPGRSNGRYARISSRAWAERHVLEDVRKSRESNRPSRDQLEARSSSGVKRRKPAAAGNLDCPAVAIDADAGAAQVIEVAADAAANLQHQAELEAAEVGAVGALHVESRFHQALSAASLRSA